jgi:hypothetical protein
MAHLFALAFFIAQVVNPATNLTGRVDVVKRVEDPTGRNGGCLDWYPEPPFYKGCLFLNP